MDATRVPAAEASAVASTKTCVAPAETGTTMSAASVTSAMLRPERHGQEKRERRNGCQAAHQANYTPDHQRDFVKFRI